MRETSTGIVESWETIRTLVESLDLDVRKNARGNVSAGIRARKGLRLLKTLTADLIKDTISEEKRRKEIKKAKKAEKTEA